MKKIISSLILGLLVLIIFTGCASDTQAETKVIARVSGSEISQEDIDERIEYTEISQKLYTGDKELNTDFTKEDAFNQLVREKVLYDEARKLGYDVKTRTEILKIIEEAKAQNALGNISPEVMENISEKYGDTEEFEKDILKEYGYSGMEDFYKENTDLLRTNLLISDLSIKYSGELYKKLENDQASLEDAQNSWANYVEHLIRNSNIEIKDDDYEVNYYGEEWKYDDLDLTSK